MMAEPLEIAISYGERNHTITVDAGDGDAANEAKEQVGFIIDLFAGSADAKKRVSAKPPAAAGSPKLSTSITPPTTLAGGAK
jgi:hypothetical protein